MKWCATVTVIRRCRVKEYGKGKKEGKKKLERIGSVPTAMEGARKSGYWREARPGYFHERGVLVLPGRAKPPGRRTQRADS